MTEVYKSQLTKKERDQYFKLVYLCLIEFHQVSPKTARDLIRSERTFVNKLIAESPAGDIVFHREPFDLACTIVGKAEMRISEAQNKRYRQLENEVYIDVQPTTIPL